MGKSIPILTVLLMLAFSIPGIAQVMMKRPMTLMGSLFDITVVAEDSALANAAIDRAETEISRIEDLISEWRPGTQVSEVNRNAGLRPVKVDREVFGLTQRAVRYAKLTGGAFDVSIAAMDRLWRYDGSMTALPDSAAIRRSVANVGYRHIVLDSIHSTIYLAKPGMKIGFGSIGKGYAADKCRELLQSGGITGGIVNASGDLAAWGAQPGGEPWAIGIRNPFKGGGMLKVLKIRTGAVATSGSYEKYAEIDGKRYSHIIDPRTGYPSSELTSVTVTGPSAEFANFLSTSIMVVGSREGRKLMKRYRQYRCLFK
ncbi:thiamine biosynthesis lipoprotein [Dyadobacter soli]|uniref:FAD:protein FMN transferase n=1 Tax=Dyadobacter soli TaxID=659014 RepID=A0A1G7SII2_9BACT|nr:FAD:protein FMN transferase [Dyadobacter soli]SDG22040.1 thiamine biosynthesis lipoprotein [Dyadobacter soli]